MRANRRVSGAEIRFRKALWSAGARGFRTGTGLPGRPDVVFSAVRMAVFVHGCFWHRCAICRLKIPRANAAFWAQKFDANQARDARVNGELRDAGWTVLTIWEHELRADLAGTASAVAEVVAGRRQEHAHGSA
jgi:DNA mismatch endonuclease (patch repair protein)